uniref:SWIM-type domain-containing protein n=1 Tax=Bubo bubo TaxID=30461 RepID=A0A8C0EEC1_BUBBB
VVPGSRDTRRIKSSSPAYVHADSDHGLDRLSFQTSKMKSSFLRFPKSLLLHRAPSEGGHVLYAFLVENKEQVGKVVHLSLLKDDTGHSVRKMLTVFKEFNPEWQKVQAVFVDISFFHRAVLQELFPSAWVLLSVSHAVRLLEKNVKEAEISSSLKQSLMLALQKAACSPSPANLDALSQLVKCVVSPELYDDLAFHFLECAEFLDAGGLESLNRGFPSTKEDGWSSLLEKPGAHLSATAIENLEGDSKEIKRRAEECIKQSLSDICTEPAAQLCLSEFAVVQKSVQLIGTEEDALSIRVLEDAHRVDMKGLSSCTCHFNQVFQLPCRHILAVLNLDRRTLQPEMLSRQWQKGCDAHQAGQDSADGLLEILKSSWDESLDKSLVVSFLTAEISRLLTHCSGEEFERRYRTLRELADGWIGPYVEVKL